MVPSLMIVSPDQLDHQPLYLVLTWLEDLVLQLRHHLGDEGRVGVDEEGDGGDQGPAVVVDHVLSQPVRELAQDRLLVEELALVAVLEVLRDTVPCVRRKFPVGHVLLHLLHFLPSKNINMTYSLKYLKILIILHYICVYFACFTLPLHIL